MRDSLKIKVDLFVYTKYTKKGVKFVMASVRTQVVDLLITELKKIDGGTATTNPGNFIEPYTFKSNVFDTNVFRNWKYFARVQMKFAY